MTHDELLAKLDGQIAGSKAIGCVCPACDNAVALRAVVELHKPEMIDSLRRIEHCSCWRITDGIPQPYPCPTIQAIEKVLND